MSGETFEQYGGSLNPEVFSGFGASFEDIASLPTSAPADIPANEASVYENVITGVMDKAAQIDAQVQELYALVQSYEDVYPTIQDNPAMLAKWELNYNKLFTAQTVINRAKSGIDAISTWWRDLNASFGGNATSGLSGLGLVVAIPWATIGVISAAGAALAAVLYSASLGLREFRRYALQKTNEERAAQGLPPIADPYANEPTILGDVGGIAKWIAIAAVAYFLINRGK